MWALVGWLLNETEIWHVVLVFLLLIVVILLQIWLAKIQQSTWLIRLGRHSQVDEKDKRQPGPHD